MRPLITINDFSEGILRDRTIQSRSGFAFGSGVDIYRKPGILRVSPELTPMTQSSVSGIDERIYNITKFTVNNALYALGSGGKVYDYNVTESGKWSLAHDLGTAGNGMTEFNNKLYFTNQTHIYEWDGAGSLSASVATAGAFSVGAANVDHPLTIFEDTLYAADGKYVASLTTDGTWDNEALDIPAGYTISCLAEYNNKLMIGAGLSTFTSIKDGAKLFAWDGASVSYSSSWDIKKRGIQAMTVWRNLLILWMGWGGDIYGFNGANIVKMAEIPVYPDGTTDAGAWEVFPGAIVEHNDRLLFGTRAPANTNYYGGLFSIGQVNTQGNLAVNQDYFISDNPTPPVTAGAGITSLATNTETGLYVGYFNGTDYGIETLSNTDKIDTGAFWESQVYDISDGSDVRQFAGVELVASPMATGDSVVIKYKLDNDADWTSLGTVNSSNQRKVFWSTKRSCKSVQLRLEFTTATGANTTPEIQSIKIY